MLYFYTATRLHARYPTSWISHRDVFIQQFVVKRQTCRGGHTICFSNFCTGWMRSSNNSLTQHNAGVPAKQSVRVSHAKCIVTSLDRKKSVPSRFHLWSSNHWDQNLFPVAWCHGTRSYTPKLTKFLAYSPNLLAQAVDLRNSPLRCPWPSPLDSVSFTRMAIIAVCINTYTHWQAMVSDALSFFQGALNS